MVDPMCCETCHRIEDDPIMLDAEIYGACGGFISACDPDPDYQRDLRGEP